MGDKISRDTGILFTHCSIIVQQKNTNHLFGVLVFYRHLVNGNEYSKEKIVYELNAAQTSCSGKKLLVIAATRLHSLDSDKMGTSDLLLEFSNNGTLGSQKHSIFHQYTL